MERSSDMIKIIAMAIIPICFFFFSFKCTSIKKSIEIDSLSKTEGWIDENTFRIIAEGRPVETLKNRDERRESAKRAAQINAWFKILKKFKTIDRDDKPQKIMSKTIGSQLQKNIKEGFVIDEIYDENDNCEIIYEIFEKDLRIKVLESDFSEFEVIN